MLKSVLPAALWMIIASAGCEEGGSSAPIDGSVDRPSRNSDVDARRDRIQDQESKMSDEAEARRQRSIALLTAENVPYMEHLPLIETEAESMRRTTEQVALRAMALCVVAVKGEGLEQEKINKLTDEYDLEAAFTPK
jgi:hypothetical protein